MPLQLPLHLRPRLMMLVCLCTLVFTVRSQNLLQNPSFETLNVPDPIVRGSPADFTAKVPGWQLIAGTHHVCTSAYTGAAVDTSNIACADGKVSPMHGRAMMELEYIPQCISPAMTKQGCSGYMQQTLAEPMRVGKLYELSMSVYIQATSNPGYANHIGFQAYTQRLPVSYNLLLDGREFLLDTVIFDRWYEAKWTIRPTCELKSIVFGVFRTEEGPPVHNRLKMEDMFFLDDLRLVEVGRDPSVEVAPYCKTEPVTDRPFVLPGTSLYFDVGKAALTAASRTELAGLAERMRENPATVFEITGFTDTTGSNHLELSERRIDSVLTYLGTVHRINPLRFVRVPAGAEKRTGQDAQTALAQSRRVSIVGVESYRQHVLYRYIVLALEAQDMKRATRLMMPWLHLATDWEVQLAGYDPRLAKLLDQPAVKQVLTKRTRRRYSRKDLEMGTDFLDSLWFEDQRTRTLGRYVENLFYYVPMLDEGKAYADVIYPDLDDAAYRSRDSTHHILLTKWLDKNDWPKLSEVGDKAASAVPLVLLHGGDTTTMNRWLPVFKKRCLAGEGEWRYYAMLYDRNQVARGLPQLYGTQFRLNGDTGERERYPVGDWGVLARERFRLGLPVVEGTND